MKQLSLADNNSCWLLETGDAELFAVDLATGKRHFLQEFHAEQWLFGVPSHERCLLIALLHDNATIKRYDKSSLLSTLNPQSLQSWQEALESKEKIPTEENWLKALDRFHIAYFAALQEKWEEIKRLEKEHVKEKTSREKSLFHASLHSLSTLLEEHPHTYNKENLLYEAASALGADLNIPLSPLPKALPHHNLLARMTIIADAWHVSTRQIRLKRKWWLENGPSFLGFLASENHPVAILKGAGHGYFLYDPKTHRTNPLSAKQAAELLPSAYEFTPPLPDKKLSISELIKICMGRHAKLLTPLAFVAIASALLNLFFPIASTLIIGYAIPQTNEKFLWQVGAAFYSAIAASTLYQFTRGTMLAGLTTWMGNRLETGLWGRLLSLPLSFFSKFAIGDLWSRLSAIPKIRRQLYSNNISIFLSAFFSIFYLFIMLFFNPKLTLLALIVSSLMILIGLFTIRKMLRLTQTMAPLKNALSGFVMQLVTGLDSLRVAGAEKRAFSRFSILFAKITKAEFNTQLLGTVISTLTSIMPTLFAMVIFAAVIHFINEGKHLMKTPDEVMPRQYFFGFLIAYNAFTAAVISALPAAFDFYNEVLPEWQRAKILFESVPEKKEDALTPPPLSGSLTAEGLFCRYDRRGRYILKNATVRVEPGAYIALLGTSGSGKSTFLRLLLGFETAEKGSILYDDHDLSHLDKAAVRKQLGVVPQEGTLFFGTLYENLSSGGLYSDEAVKKALRLSRLDQVIAKLPDGLETSLTKNPFSGDERQLLLLAKALVSEPKILFLDEATSRLDILQEEQVLKNLKELSMTRILLTSNRRTASYADRVYRLEKGEIRNLDS